MHTNLCIICVRNGKGNNASGACSKNFLGSQELVADVTDGGVDLAKVEIEALSEDLQAMSLGERVAYVGASVPLHRKSVYLNAY